MALSDVNAQAYVEYAQLAGAEISLKVTTLIQRLCDQLHPQVIIDLGSGWSSFALRTMCPKAEVWSVDTDVNWLKKTIRFCERHGVTDDGRFVMWERFEQELPRLLGIAGLVVHDIGRVPMRLEKLPTALDLVRPGGVIVLDDMHKEELLDGTVKVLATRPDFVINDTKGETLDEHTRFAWTATRSPDLVTVNGMRIPRVHTFGFVGELQS